MTGSPVRRTVDLDAHGRQVGTLDLPRSTNTGGWSALRIPIVAVAGGDGPSALVVGGCHGDEPEGQVAALDLVRELRLPDVPGRLLVVPCLSVEASRAYTRLWPSGANMNRSVPGDPEGTPDEQLAHFLSTELFPRVDVVVDIHSGGRSGMCLPWSEMHRVEDPEQRRRMIEGMLAWNTDWCVVCIDIAGGGLLVGEAERQGKPLQTILRATDLADYRLAPASGLFGTLVGLGDRVEAGPTVGLVHFSTTWSERRLLWWRTRAGVVCVIRAIATTEQGDNVIVIGHEIDRAEMEGAERAKWAPCVVAVTVGRP